MEILIGKQNTEIQNIKKWICMGWEYAFNTSNNHISIGYDYMNVIERFYKNI